jgi:hypothetical protein
MRDDNFNEEDYVPVHERIVAFRKDHPEGAILTERFADGDVGIFFKAKVYKSLEERKNETPASSAHTYLPDSAREDLKVEEATETAAVGRALAFLGYELSKGIASKDEVDGEDEEETEEEPPKRTKLSAKKTKPKVEDDEEEIEEEEIEEEEIEEEKPKTKLNTKRKFQRTSKLTKGGN